MYIQLVTGAGQGLACEGEEARARFGITCGVVFLLTLVLSPAAAEAQTFTAPSSVRASPDGSFSYAAVFTADAAAGVDVAGSGFNALMNVEPPQSHGDGFCGPHVDPGEQVRVEVAGSLIDLAESGLVEAWFAPCDGPTLRVQTAILPPGGPRRFVITGHPPLSEIQMAGLVAKGRKFQGTAALILEGGADDATAGVTLDVVQWHKADRSVYRMTSQRDARAQVKVRIVTRGDPETVQGARIDYRANGGKKIRVRGPSIVRADHGG